MTFAYWPPKLVVFLFCAYTFVERETARGDGVPRRNHVLPPEQRGSGAGGGRGGASQDGLCQHLAVRGAAASDAAPRRKGS